MSILKHIRQWQVTRRINKMEALLKDLRADVGVIEAQLNKISKLNEPRYARLEAILRSQLKFSFDLQLRAGRQVELHRLYLASLVSSQSAYEEALRQLEKDTEKRFVELSKFLDNSAHPGPENPLP